VAEMRSRVHAVHRQCRQVRLHVAPAALRIDHVERAVGEPDALVEPVRP
jgi:hypothetical protein